MGERHDEAEELADFATLRADPDETPVIVIAGCGTATTVEKLREYGVDAYGFDISSDILDAADEQIREFLTEVDIRDDNLVESLCSEFEVDRIDILVTECMLSFLSVGEAQRTLAQLRDAPNVGVLAHRLQRDAPAAAQEGEIDATLMPLEEWQETCDPNNDDIWRDSLARWNLPP